MKRFTPFVLLTVMLVLLIGCPDPPREYSGFSNVTTLKDLHIVDTTATTATIAWAPVANASSYIVAVDPASNGPFSDRRICYDTSYQLIGLEPNTPVYVKVSAITPFGESTPSAALTINISVWITALTPNGAFFYHDDEIELTWTSKNAGDSVKIELVQSDSVVHTIAHSTPNDGSYYWTIPQSIPHDFGYQIRISSTTVDVHHDGWGFNIVPDPGLVGHEGHTHPEFSTGLYD